MTGPRRGTRGTQRQLVVAAPLAIEARAVRRGLPGGVVVRAGLRARRAGRGVARSRWSEQMASGRLRYAPLPLTVWSWRGAIRSLVSGGSAR